jgi:hypothetical protein
VYYYYGPDKVKRLWHDCKEYKKDEKRGKKGQERRLELKPAKPTKDLTIYKCPHCDFSYVLDNHLVLIQSK